MITEAQYRQLREKIDAFQAAWQKKFPGKNSLSQAELAKLPPNPTNEERSAVEVYEFVTMPPGNYFVYIKEDQRIATTWMGDKLGDVSFGTQHRDNFGGIRVPITMTAINGVTYHGTYFKSAGDYARIKAAAKFKGKVVRETEGMEASEPAGKTIDRNKIQAALTHVHKNEQQVQKPVGGSRAELAKQAIQSGGLNDDEAAILLSALHVSSSEISEPSKAKELDPPFIGFGDVFSITNKPTKESPLDNQKSQWERVVKRAKKIANDLGHNVFVDWYPGDPKFEAGWIIWTGPIFNGDAPPVPGSMMRIDLNKLGDRRMQTVVGPAKGKAKEGPKIFPTVVAPLVDNKGNEIVDYKDLRNSNGKTYILRFLPYLELSDGRPVEAVIGYTPRGRGYGRWEEFFRTLPAARKRMEFLIASGAIEDAELRKEVSDRRGGKGTILVDEWRAEGGRGAGEPTKPKAKRKPKAKEPTPKGNVEWRRRQIILEPDLDKHLFEWHGGQFTAVYALASTGMENLVSLSMIDAALAELRKDERTAKGKQKKDIKKLIGDLQGVRVFWRESSAQESGMLAGMSPEEIEAQWDYDRADYGFTPEEEAEIPTKSG